MASLEPEYPVLTALAIFAFVGAAYAFACGGAARLAHFRHLRARAPSTPMDVDFACRVASRQAMLAMLLITACATAIVAIADAPLAVAGRIALLAVPAFVASVATATLVRLRRFVRAIGAPGTTIAYDGGYYVSVARSFELRAWLAATPAALARAHSVPQATALRI